VDILEKGLEQAFQVDGEGRVVFYPFGMLSKGRLIRDRQTMERVRGTFALLILVGAGGVTAISIASHFVISFKQGLAADAILLSLCVLGTQLLAMGLPYADERLSARAAMRNAGSGHSTLRLIVLSVLAWVMTTVGVIVLLVGDAESQWIGFTCICFFGFCLCMFIWQIVAKNRQATKSVEIEREQGSTAARGSTVVSRRRDR
jgi:hypothetical protein